LESIASRTLDLLTRLVANVPVGTNLGLIHLLWMMASGRLLSSRGAIIPGLDAMGLTEDAVRRAWMALGHGSWEIDDLIEIWTSIILEEMPWRPHRHGGYVPIAVDVTHFSRPRLKDCPTKHYPTKTGHTVPAIPIGLIARVGEVGGQRLGIPLAMVRALIGDPSREAHARELVRQTAAMLGRDEVGVFDRGFQVSQFQSAGLDQYVVRLVKNFSARQAKPREYTGCGRRPTLGEIVRPLSRKRRGRQYEATTPDRIVNWKREGVKLRAECWDNLVLSGAKPGGPTFRVVAIHDPRYIGPMLLATSLDVSPEAAHGIYIDRWPVEQLPLAAKQMVGASRQFVHDPETCQRLPELSLMAGSILSFLAATEPAIPTGFWDRKPMPTPGRLRRVLGRLSFPEHQLSGTRVRRKQSATAHLPKGHWGQRRRRSAPETPQSVPA
jgi:hypothetical protein